ncbi:MAG: carboxypeptidase-like regulatory domain-containing protein, partial [Sphingobacteriales bacterium]
MYKATTFIAILLMSILTASVSSQTKSAGIQGKITTADGAPAAYVNVGIKGIKSTISGEDGSFILKNIPAGNHIVKVSYVGLSGEEKTVILKEGETFELDFRLQETSQKLSEVVVTA